MPGLDGFEVCRRIRRNPLIAEIPVVLVTALDDMESRLEGIDAGADDFLSKPLDRAELRLRVRTITRLNRYRRVLAERMRFQQTTQQAAREWATTFDAISSPVLVLDANGTVRRLNTAARNVARGRFDDVVGRPVGEIGPGEPWRAAAQLAIEALQRDAQSTVRVTDSDSGRVWDVASSRTSDGEATIIVVARDVTEMVELEEESRRNAMMLALGRLVGGVAHEVRNPLFSITAAIDAFEADFGGRPELDEYFDVIRRESARLARLAQDLLEYGRPIALERAPAPLGRVMHRAVEACRVTADRVGVAIEVP